MNYILKHWRGEFPLAISLWINFILLMAGIRSAEWLFRKAKIVEQPQYAARLLIVYLILLIGIIMPWQIIGVWRACKHHKEQTGKKFLARTFRGFAIFVLLLYVVAISSNLPAYIDDYRLGFMKDKYANYTIDLKNDGTLIYLKGNLGFGVSKEVEKLLRKHPKVRGIVLDSYGGYIYEGRQLSKLITFYGLNTYSFNVCCSACTTAFIAGNKRFLGTDAILGFHQFRSVYSNLAKYLNLQKEQEKDKLIFKRQGITQEFLDKMFNAHSDDLWFPSVDELLKAGIIHAVVDPCEILEVKPHADPNGGGQPPSL